MSIIDNKDGKYVRVDLALGSSKTNAIKYYSSVIDYLKEILQNSPMVLIILDYMKHIPFFAYYDITSIGDLSNKFYGFNIDFYTTDKENAIKNTICRFICNKTFINDSMFIFDFIKNSKLENGTIVEFPSKEIILCLFSKHGTSKNFTDGNFSRLRNIIMFNKNYIITSNQIEQSCGIYLNKNIYITIVPTPEDKLFNDKFDVIVSFSDKEEIMITEYNYYMENYVNNMYYMVNFSKHIKLEGVSVNFLHPFFRRYLKEQFPKLYESKTKEYEINIKSCSLYIIKRRILYEEYDGDIKTTIKIPPELDNVFVHASIFKITSKIVPYYSKYKVDIKISFV
jgi:hypothetical protein